MQRETKEYLTDERVNITLMDVYNPKTKKVNFRLL